jgi:PKD repeat protein
MRRKTVNVLMGLFFAVAFGMAGCGGGGGGGEVTAANAGPAQNIDAGSLVTLSGAQSTGADGSIITYEWSMISKPSDSVANINDATTINPTFTADLPGQYSVKLTITDAKLTTSEAIVTITVSVANAAPVANAGTAQSVVTGALVTLDGSASTDVNNDAMTYSWGFISKPVGSSATLSAATVSNPTFAADIAGDYVLSLVVNDGKKNSDVSAVTVTAYKNLGDVTQTNNNININVKKLFYVRNSSGTIYTDNIIAAKIIITNGGANQIPFYPSDFHIIDGTNKIDYTTYAYDNGSGTYDELGSRFISNEFLDLLPNVYYVVFITFKPSTILSNNKCYIVSSSSQYPINVMFTNDMIK